MNTAIRLTAQIEAYLGSLRAHISPMGLAEREEILREIAAHIRDSAESGLPIETVLARLGSSETLAAQYRDGALIRSASRSMSPVTLFGAPFGLPRKGPSVFWSSAADFSDMRLEPVFC